MVPVDDEWSDVEYEEASQSCPDVPPDYDVDQVSDEDELSEDSKGARWRENATIYVAPPLEDNVEHNPAESYGRAGLDEAIHEQIASTEDLLGTMEALPPLPFQMGGSMSSHMSDVREEGASETM